MDCQARGNKVRIIHHCETLYLSVCAGKGRRWSVARCWSRRHTTSIADAGRTITGSTWTEDGKRLEAGPIVDWGRLCMCTPDRSGVVSHRWEDHMCPHPVTREPSSSWTANTSLQWALQEEVERSDPGGTRPKGGNHLGSRREGKRGTPGLLLPPKDHPRSSSSGCQPATACLQGRLLHSRRTFAMNWLYWLV
jgi:hypothetical protein